MNKVDPIIIELLAKRGITDEAEIEEFLSDKPKATYDPFLLPDMEAGVDLLLKHADGGSKICIYGDYDADGITSVAVLSAALSELTDNFFYYIPSRFSEGYGLNKDAVRSIAEQGTGLIVTVDCGSVSYEETALAKELGMDIMVTDHHTIVDKVADCIVINPKLPGSAYPFPHLAGVGVAFKLVQALSRRGRIPKSVVNGVLDLVAIGTIGDIVPLTDENRTIAKFGLRELNRQDRSRPGLDALLERISLKRGSISAQSVAFAIVPHLNAAGRMEDARLGAELLLSCGKDDFGRREELAGRLAECNSLRKKYQEETYESCLSSPETLEDMIIINAGDAHEGITGIVAGKLKETFNRPAIIVTPSGDDGLYLKGTGRSIDGIDLYELLATQSRLFEKFGGHAGACGFTIKKEHFEELKAGLKAETARMLLEDPGLFDADTDADMQLEPEDITVSLAEELELLGPFGCENPRPVFALCGVSLGGVGKMGSKGNHYRFYADKGAGKVQCVYFGVPEEKRKMLFDGNRVTLLGSVEVSEWRGERRVQMKIESIEEQA